LGSREKSSEKIFLGRLLKGHVELERHDGTTYEDDEGNEPKEAEVTEKTEVPKGTDRFE
jgi:hypothetical protein